MIARDAHAEGALGMWPAFSGVVAKSGLAEQVRCRDTNRAGGLEHALASHVLGRALWHALALTDASPRVPPFCSTTREDKRNGFTIPPQF